MFLRERFRQKELNTGLKKKRLKASEANAHDKVWTITRCLDLRLFFHRRRDAICVAQSGIGAYLKALPKKFRSKAEINFFAEFKRSHQDLCKISWLSASYNAG